MPRFNRVYSLVAGPAGGTGIEISQTLRLTFDIVKRSDKNPNKSKILIWNLRPENREALERPNTRCVLKVGYAEEGGPIEAYQGDVHFAFSKYDGPNVITELELGEGAKAIRDGMVTLGYGSGISSDQALRDVAGQMDLDLSMPDDVPTRTWNNGLSLHGPARNAMDRISQGTGLEWSIQNGQLQIIRAGGTTNRTVFELSAETGLIRVPERERKGAHETDAQVTDEKTHRKKRVASATEKEDGWRIHSLILPSLVPGDRVKLASRSVQGVFKIKEVRHTGDTHGGDWVTELKLLDPKAAATDRRAAKPPGRTSVRQTPSGPLPLPPPAPPDPFAQAGAPPTASIPVGPELPVPTGSEPPVPAGAKSTLGDFVLGTSKLA